MDRWTFTRLYGRIERAFVVDRLKDEIDRPIIAFCNERLTRGLAELCREAITPDNVFDLLAEGWASQALAHITRAARLSYTRRTVRRGGVVSTGRCNTLS